MKRLGLLSTVLVLAGLSAQHAYGLAVTTNFDEFGNGSTTFQNFGSLASGLITDPSGGIAGSVLAYLLPYPAVEGDVQLNEIVGATVVLSDIVRFFNVGTLSYVLFYSDNGDGVDAPADTGLPGNALTNVVTIQEIGPEGANGATYTPTPGQPGYINSDFTATYNIVSDNEVPEPASMMLMGAGIVALGAFKRYRR
jgi:hypothetical protein